MSLPVRALSVAISSVWSLVFLLGISASAQTNYYSANGTEYPIVGSLLGDQVYPDVAISPTGGLVVWQDNATDGDGWGVSARRLDSTLSGTLGTFRVNVSGAGDQEHPHVALLKNGGAVFVWQGGKPAFQHIYARFLTASNTFLTTNDLTISTYSNSFQINPSVAVLTNGNVAVVWASYNQVSSNSMQDVYCQILSTNGTPIGGNFLVNQFTNYNQRTPTVAALKNGGFVVAWVSEQQNVVLPNMGTNTVQYTASTSPEPSIDIYARLFNASGVGTSGEILVNTNSDPCASPAAASATDGTFMITWCANVRSDVTRGWDIYARPFTITGTGGAVTLVNTHVYGDQYSPRINSIGLDYFVTWTSLGQDGSHEGVFAQFIHSTGAPVGVEQMVNTTTLGQQMQAVVAADGVGQFLTVWTGYTTSPFNNLDLFAQRFVNVAAILQPMPAPFVWVPFVISNNVYQPELMVTWSPVVGLSVSNYEVYADGASVPTATTVSNTWIMTAANGLTKSSTHSFTVDYVTSDGRRSPISPSASGTTWGGVFWGGIPFEWMTAYYGSDISQWPAANSNMAPGVTLYQIFLSGGNPLDSSTWLHQQLVKSPQGMFLTWNPQPGATYQVQVTTDLVNWSNFGSPRFAAGTSDSIDVGGNSASYYRILLLR